MTTMDLTNIKASFERLNHLAQKGGTVLFGSTFASRIPFSELMRDYTDDTAGYNRSIEGLTVIEAQQCLSECVFQLEPVKIFINLGDADSPEDCEAFIRNYEWLLYSIHSGAPAAHIYILSIYDPSGAKYSVLNDKLKKLAESTGCSYITVSPFGPAPEISAFEKLKTMFRTKPISFFDAINSAV